MERLRAGRGAPRSVDRRPGGPPSSRGRPRPGRRAGHRPVRSGRRHPLDRGGTAGAGAADGPPRLAHDPAGGLRDVARPRAHHSRPARRGAARLDGRPALRDQCPVVGPSSRRSVRRGGSRGPLPRPDAGSGGRNLRRDRDPAVVGGGLRARPASRPVGSPPGVRLRRPVAAGGRAADLPGGRARSRHRRALSGAGRRGRRRAGSSARQRCGARCDRWPRCSPCCWPCMSATS